MPPLQRGGYFILLVVIVFLDVLFYLYFWDMATEFIQSEILTKEYVLTSEARSISAFTEEPKLSVSLTCTGVTFFSVELYAAQGVVELFDPGALVEDFFIANRLICENVTVKFGSASTVLRFLYCENVMPQDFDPSKALLLSSTVRRVRMDSKFTVAAIDDDENQFVIKAVGHDSNGMIASVQFIQPLIFITDTNLSVSLIVNKATGLTPISQQNMIANPLKDVMYFSVEHAGRQLMCYITPAAAFISFQFRNIYNVPELIDVEGVVVTKSETSRSSAICSGDIVQYDRKTDRTYQFTSGPLTSEEVESMQQLISSHSVQISVDGVMHDVIIDDHTCEASTEDDELSVVKFTWRFKGRRPVQFNSAFFGILPSRRDIFSDEYSPEYE